MKTPSPYQRCIGGKCCPNGEPGTGAKFKRCRNPVFCPAGDCTRFCCGVAKCLARLAEHAKRDHQLIVPVSDCKPEELAIAQSLAITLNITSQEAVDSTFTSILGRPDIIAHDSDYSGSMCIICKAGLLITAHINSNGLVCEACSAQSEMPTGDIVRLWEKRCVVSLFLQPAPISHQQQSFVPTAVL